MKTQIIFITLFLTAMLTGCYEFKGNPEPQNSGLAAFRVEFAGDFNQIGRAHV